jgi:hypothetical protein
MIENKFKKYRCQNLSTSPNSLMNLDKHIPMAIYSVRNFSKKSSPKPLKKSNQVYSKKSKLKKLTNCQTNLSKLVPSAGFIGKTRLDLIYQLFKGKLPMEWNLEDLLNETVKAHDDIIMHRGVVNGTSRWKAITQYSIGLLEGRDPENPGWVSTGRVNKWPKVLGHLRPVYVFIKDNISSKDMDTQKQIAEAMRLCLTLFKLNKICTANSDMSSLLDNIGKRKRLDPKFVSDFEKYVRIRLQKESDSIALADLDINLFLSPSNGPNALPKLNTALLEASVLEKNSALLQALKRICTITNSNNFFTFFTQCAKKYRNLPSKLTDIKLRKLTAIPDKGNKARVIAVCDIWTQSVLAPLERVVVEVSARLFPNNLAYFSHRDGWERIKSLPMETRERCVSLDASSWTDNFPASLQYIVVKALFGESMSLCWKTLAVDCEWYVPHMPRPIKFGKGQGMGTKGSFAIAQLTDLLFVEYVLNREYGQGSYFIKVGDDLVAEDPECKLQSWYESIGVPINLSKSKFLTHYGSFQEFVSRNLWNNHDYSSISPGLAAKFFRNSFYSLTFYHHVAERMDQHPSIHELLMNKKAVLESGANFDPESWKVRHERLIKVINLLMIGCKLDPNILEPEHIIPIQGEEALLISQRMILLTIGLVTHYTTVLNSDDTFVAQENLTNMLVGELSEFRSTKPIQLTLSKGEELYEGIIKNELTFMEAVLLQRSRTFVSKISDSISKGSQNLSCEPRFEPVRKCSITGVLTLNPQFVDYITTIWSTLLECVTNHKVVGTNPFANRNPGRNDLELFKFMNNCLVESDNIILDLEYGTYNVPGTKDLVVVLPKDLIDGYTQLFKFDLSLSLLDKLGKS